MLTMNWIDKSGYYSVRNDDTAVIIVPTLWETWRCDIYRRVKRTAGTARRRVAFCHGQMRSFPTLNEAHAYAQTIVAE